MDIFFKYFLAWFPMLLIAVINGTARDLGYKPFMDELAAHHVSTISLIVFFGVYVYYIVSVLPPGSGVEAILLGIMWTVMTLLFEFGFGRYQGALWEQLLADYNIFKGRIWILIPVWVAIAPYVFFKLQK